MADEPARTVPKITDPVHYVPRSIAEVDDNTCIAGTIVHIPKTEDGDPHPRGRAQIGTLGYHASVVDLALKKDVTASTRVAERSSEGHAGTWHFPHECPFDN